MPRPPDPLVGDGLLLVDKPAGMTSHDVVGACRRICGTRKVGHAGTLDPMATGLLLVGVNKATRLLTFLVGCDKTYEATIRLGQATVTDDAEGEVTASVDVRSADVSPTAVAAAVAALTGDIAQVPSAVSAIKIDGVRSYARVRGGEDVDLPARAVHVAEFVVLDRREGLVGEGEAATGVVDLDVRVSVSSGTYVRALARDLGASLGVGGHLTALRRTRVGGYSVADAHAPDALRAAREAAPAGRSGLPMLPLADAAAAALPVRRLTQEEAGRLAHGVRIPSAEAPRGPVAALAPDGRLVAVVEEPGRNVKVLAVFGNGE